MNATPFCRPPASLRAPRRERGAVLIMTLILLVVATLIALSAQRNTALEERMAGNLLDRNLSFQAAEAALRGGESALANAVAAGSVPVLCSADAGNCAAGWYTAASGAQTPVWKRIGWGDGNSVPIAVAPPSGSTSPLAANPRYIIEQLDASTSTWRVTARATGGSGAGVVVLQSIYITE
ncbi:MAG TPA: PilX N-terminal domain-containing pilus assembly protein [Plasticicumulans sp.]|nr:PilX N-terminal domain-containing pilus assembly protein [Plasticicumulans sp.]